MTTSQELREMAKASEDRARESFERCDTDGFVSQWASGVTASKLRLQADLVENGGAILPALFDLKGNLIAAKEVETRHGYAWGILSSDDPHSQIVKWFNPSKARDEGRARANNSMKGYYIGEVKVKSVKAELGGSGTGLSGALSVRPYIQRTDGGFSRDVEIIDDGKGE